MDPSPLTPRAMSKTGPHPSSSMYLAPINYTRQPCLLQKTCQLQCKHSLPWTLSHLKTRLQIPTRPHVLCRHTPACPCAQPLAENFAMASECTTQPQRHLQQREAETTTSGPSDHAPKKSCTTARTMQQKGDQATWMAAACSGSY